MALPTGQISMSQVNVELGLSSTATISLNQANVRTLAGVPSGAISMQTLQGKANEFAFTIASNVTNANLRTLAVNAGWNQTSKVVATINSGIYISSNSTGTPALTINGSFPGGVELTNNGFIIGRGGNGGVGRSISSTNGSTSGGANGGQGGLALAVSVAASVRNNGTIAGGGGGGGGGAASAVFDSYFGQLTQTGAGGGGGGGRSSAAANASAGGGGVVTTNNNRGIINGASGGVGTLSAAGGGGLNGYNVGRGGNGGGWGAAGGGSTSVSPRTRYGANLSGGAGGAAVSGNSNITYLATGTRLGAIT